MRNVNAKLVTRQELRGKEPYEWPQPAYQLLEDMKRMLGISLAMQIQIYLQGKATGHYLTPSFEKIFRDTAAKRGVQI